MTEAAEFHGFHEPDENWCKLPFELIAQLPRISTKAELCVILYVLRHTWGYREFQSAKAITMDEFANGRKRKDGTRIDAGIGMSEPSIREGLNKAKEHGFLDIDVNDDDLGRVEKSYRLVMYDYTTTRNEIQGERNLPPAENEDVGGKKLTPRPQETLPRTEKDTLERTVQDLTAPFSGAVETATAVEGIGNSSEIPNSSETERPQTQQGARPRTERQQMIDFCIDFWKCPGGEAAMRADQLLGRSKSGKWKEANLSPGATVAEAKGWRLWIERSRKEVPVAAWVIEKSFLAFRSSQAYQDAIHEANNPVPVVMSAPEIVSPEVALARQQEYRATIAALAAGKRLIPERNAHESAA